MTVSVAQRVQHAYDAGFRNSDAIEALSVIVAISMCECGVGSACETGCNPDCCGCGCSSGCQSCGVLQVFQPCHPGTSGCAVDPSCAFTLGWTISNAGTSFGAWSTYNDGCYQGNLGAVRAAIASLPPPIGPAPPSPPPCPVCDSCSSCQSGTCVSRCVAPEVCSSGACIVPCPVCDQCSVCSGGVCVSSCPTDWDCLGGLCVPPFIPVSPGAGAPLARASVVAFGLLSLAGLVGTAYAVSRTGWGQGAARDTLAVLRPGGVPALGGGLTRSIALPALTASRMISGPRLGSG
jgi:hypothetical protein